MKRKSAIIMRGVLFSLMLCLFVYPPDNPNDPTFSTSHSPSSSMTLFWWNQDYQYRVPLLITNPNSESIPVGFVVNITFNSMELVTSGKMLSNGQDLRVVWYNLNDLEWIELDRINRTAFNSASTDIVFQIQANIESSDLNYYLYYGFQETTNPLLNPPSNPSKIYSYYTDFNSNNSMVDWSIGTGVWNIIDQHLIKTAPSSVSTILSNNPKIQNSEIEVMINNSGTDIGAGIVFRYQNDKKLYLAGIGILGTHVALAQSSPSGEIEIIQSDGKPESLIMSDIWYTLKVVFYETRIQIYLNNTMVLDITDSSQNKEGIYGLQTLTSDVVSYDNFKVRDLLAIEPEIIPQTEMHLEFKLNEVDMIEMGEKTEISLEFEKPELISQVLLEYEFKNHSMTKTENIFTYSDWKPTLIGEMNYSIHIQYTDLTWTTIQDSLIIQDTLKPELVKYPTDLIEIASQNSVPIEIEIYETGSGIISAIFEVNNVNYSMNMVNAVKWRCSDWYPSEQGVYTYRVYLLDAAGNSNVFQSSIQVKITTSNEISITLILCILGVVIGSAVMVSNPNLQRYFGHANHFGPNDHRSSQKLNKIRFKSMMEHLDVINDIKNPTESIHTDNILNSPSYKSDDSDSPIFAFGSDENYSTLKVWIPADLHETFSGAEKALKIGAYKEAIARYTSLANDFDLKGAFCLSQIFQAKAEKIQVLVHMREILQKELCLSEGPEMKQRAKEILLGLIEISQKLNDLEAIIVYLFKLVALNK